MLKTIIAIGLTVVFASNSYAEIKYNEKMNAAILKTSIFSEGDIGRLLIQDVNTVYLTAFGKHDNGKAKLLCGISPGVSVTYQDSNLNTYQKSLVVTKYITQHNSLNYTDKDMVAGFVSEYMFEGDIAQDLIRSLLAHGSVKFEISGDKCASTNSVAAGKFILEFETHGLESALAQIK
jgi:hypothetical protein